MLVPRACSEVDMEGTTDWYKRYFSKQPPLAATTGVTDMVITRSARTPPLRTTTRAMYCAPTAATDQQDCSLSGRLESSGSVQTTWTNAFSFQGKVAAVYKWKSAVHVLTVENAVDFGCRCVQPASLPACHREPHEHVLAAHKRAANSKHACCAGCRRVQLAPWLTTFVT